MSSRLAGWRKSALAPGLPTLVSTIGVPHATWLSWERGGSRPTRPQAAALERLTKGRITEQDWGYPPGPPAKIDPVIEQRLARFA